MLLDLHTRFYIHLGAVCLLPAVLLILIFGFMAKAMKGGGKPAKYSMAAVLLVLVCGYITMQWTIPHIQDYQLIRKSEVVVLQGTIDDYRIQHNTRSSDRMAWMVIDEHLVKDPVSPSYFDLQNKHQQYKMVYLPNSDKIYEVERIGP